MCIVSDKLSNLSNPQYVGLASLRHASNSTVTLWVAISLSPGDAYMRHWTMFRECFVLVSRTTKLEDIKAPYCWPSVPRRPLTGFASKNQWYGKGIFIKYHHCPSSHFSDIDKHMHALTHLLTYWKSKTCKLQLFWCWDWDEYVNTTAADALCPCVARSSAVMILTV